MLNFNFMAGYFDSDISFPGLSVSPTRIVDMYEMEFYYEDGVTYIDGVRYPVSRGSVISCTPGSVRYSELPLRSYYIKLDEGNRDFTAFIVGMPTHCTSGILDICRACIKDILTGWEQENSFRILAGFSMLFAELQEERPAFRGTESEQNHTVVKEAIRFMTENLQNPCPLERIAESVHLSPIYFHSIFKNVTGETPLAYLTRKRIEKAKILLVTENLSTSRIAELCGFSSDIYFASVFRKTVGCTPRQYRLKKMQASWNG